MRVGLGFSWICRRDLVEPDRLDRCARRRIFSCDNLIAIERCRRQKIRCRSRAAWRANWREEFCSLTVTSRQPPVDFRRTKI